VIDWNFVTYHILETLIRHVEDLEYCSFFEHNPLSNTNRKRNFINFEQLLHWWKTSRTIHWWQNKNTLHIGRTLIITMIWLFTRNFKLTKFMLFNWRQMQGMLNTFMSWRVVSWHTMS
jgi:hypothetical protein